MTASTNARRLKKWHETAKGIVLDDAMETVGLVTVSGAISDKKKKFFFTRSAVYFG